MQKVKILIVDDEEDYCMIMKAYFEEKGCEVEVANTLGEGLQKIESVQPDVLFLDNNLPDGEGWKHAAQIHQARPRMKINLISAYEHRSPATEGLSNVKVWEKPISIESLEEFTTL